jgi:hypothetical protein
VKVHCDEGVAIHIGPRAVRRHPRGPGEASVGERIGQPWSREKYVKPSADVLINYGRQYGTARYRKRPTGSAWSKTLACAEAL